MSVTTRVPSDGMVIRKKFLNSSFMRMTRYVVLRLLTLFMTVVVGVYLTILIANMGGYVDEIIRGQIRDTVTQSVAGSPNAQSMDPEQRRQLIEERIALEEKRRGLDAPIAIRNFRYLTYALQLDLGRASKEPALERVITPTTGSR